MITTRLSQSPPSNQCVLVAGLVKIDIGAPLESTAARAKGFDFGLVALLEKPDDVKVYAEHPEHQKYHTRLTKYDEDLSDVLCRVHKLRESLCDDTLAYDLVF